MRIEGIYYRCCQNGKLNLKHIPKPPKKLYDLWTIYDKESIYFRQNARKFNTNFCMASTGIKRPKNLPHNLRYPGFLSHQGKLFF